MSVVTVAQLSTLDVAATADALRHIIACHLQVQPARHRACHTVDTLMKAC